MKEILKTLVQKIDLPQDHYLNQDAEILGIFVEELDEILEILQPQLEHWFENADTQHQVLIDIRRYFHTLKGSGRMVGANSSGELAWTVEDTLNRVIAQNLGMTPTLQAYVKCVFNIYKYKLYPEFNARLAHHLDFRPLIVLGHQIQTQQDLDPALKQLLSDLNQLNCLDALTGLEQDHDVPDAITQINPLPEYTSNFVSQTTTENLSTETLSIFIEESEEHLATIECFLTHEQHSSEQYNRLIRALHTLRGSSSMANVEEIFEASSKLEHLFKRLIQKDTESSVNENALLTHYAEFVKDYLFTLKSKTENKLYLSEIDQKFHEALERYYFQVEYSHEFEQSKDLVSQLVHLNIDVLLDAEFEFDQRAIDEFPAYFEQLSREAQSLIENTQNRAAQGIHDFSLVLKESYDTLLHKPELLNTDYLFELFAEVHQEFIHLFDTLASGERVILKESTQKLLENLSTYLQQDVVTVQRSKADVITQSDSPQEDLNEASIQSAIGQVLFAIKQDKQSIESDQALRTFDSDILAIFVEEADELLTAIDHELNTWSEDLGNITALNNLLRCLHTLKGGANMLQAVHIGLIAHELESIYERIIRNQIQAHPTLVECIRSIQDDMTDRIQILREHSIDYSALNILNVLRRIEEIVNDQESNVLQDHQENSTLQFSIAAEENDHPRDVIKDIEPIQSITRNNYLEEAQDLLADAKNILSQWFDQRSNRSLLLQLQRIAHTLKGGAKMLHIESVIEITSELETVFEKFGLHYFNSNAYDDLLQTAFNWLEAAILQENYQYFESLKRNLTDIEYVDISAQLPNKLKRTDLLRDRHVAEFVQGDGTEPPSMFGEWGQSEKVPQNNEMIRISSDLLEKMIDLSGENAITRSRIEMDLGLLGHTLSDMELAIQRLADQLRRMEGELESQILAKHSDFNPRYSDFDPLEMDQYSSLNQLSKSLAESASDLVDFKTTLSEKIRDTEGLLLQQSRIQAEIQEGLMRTRLAPFSRVLPRLQRLVRQTASTLHRPTELIVNNTEGELDRSILEKLMSPLEHMLRNAIDHGIEDAHERQRLNKPAVGRIDLNISRQGGDVILNFKDDGKGIDAALIKEKALQQGLIRADQHLEKEELLQLIFHSGFSTAAQITQISGRGVGLDVVHSEIKSLGGQVTVASDLGLGSSFTIRVPTAVAVSDALMLKVGDQQFAMPLMEIDRIVRVSSNALDEFFRCQDEYFEIDNKPYKLRYLGEFIGHQPIPRLQGVAHSLPVLLIKSSTGQTIALLIDQLVGSRAQIVVKSLGRQFASLGCIAGATILGDGNVCLILDGQNIARQIQTTPQIQKDIQQLKQQVRSHQQRRLVMIVDDSVTVRKVTSRLLERNGFDVVTAKDGVDAIEQLENIRPDLMLLDIEMPRMDGFEVTNLVRHHHIHRHLPIMMITSRTGEKHRERALGLGITHYMGKPFQEAELLKNIEVLLQKDREC